MMANYEVVEFVAIVQHLTDKFTIGAFPHTKNCDLNRDSNRDYFCACPHRPKKARFESRLFFTRVHTGRKIAKYLTSK